MLNVALTSVIELTPRSSLALLSAVGLHIFWHVLMVRFEFSYSDPEFDFSHNFVQYPILLGLFFMFRLETK